MSRICLKVLLFVVITAIAPLKADAATDNEPPEPPPAPLLTESPTDKDAAKPADKDAVKPTDKDAPAKSEAPAPPISPAQAARKAARKAAHRVSSVAWAGVAVTLASLTAGIVFGVLAQQRSDSVSLSTTQLQNGVAPVYDAAQASALTNLQNQGQSYNGAAITLLLVSGVAAVTSGVLFWDAAGLAPKEDRLALAPSFGPISAPSAGTATAVGGILSLSGRF
jgi:hypothetical protein